MDDIASIENRIGRLEARAAIAQGVAGNAETGFRLAA